MPQLIKSTVAAASIVVIDGNTAPNENAIAVLTVPATSPLVMAMYDASSKDTLRVRLLSIAQNKHAPTYRIDR